MTIVYPNSFCVVKETDGDASYVIDLNVVCPQCNLHTWILFVKEVDLGQCAEKTTRQRAKPIMKTIYPLVIDLIEG